MRRRILIVLCLLSFVSPRIGAQGPSYVFDKQTDFSRYKTYKWASFPNAARLDELTEMQLTGTLQMELAKKGLKKAQTGEPDLYVAYELAPSNPRELRYFEVSWPDGSKTEGAGGVGGASVLLHPGELVLDVYDAAKKQLLWRGAAPMPGSMDGKPEKRQKQMDKTAEKLLKNYPPR